MKGDTIVRFILAIVILLGIVTVWIGSHEIVHIFQYKSENKSIASICFVGYDDNSFNDTTLIGWVQGTPSKGDWEPNETSASWIANIITLILIFLIIYYFSVINVKKLKNEK